MLQIGDACCAFEAQKHALSECFYDNLNSRICTVRGNGAMGVSAKTLDAGGSAINTRINDAGRISTLKFNSTLKLIAVQRSEATIDIITVDPSSSTSHTEIHQPCKLRSARIKGVEWVAVNQFLLITTASLELYQVSDDRKRTIKLLRSVNVIPEWSFYHPPSNLLLVATGANAATLQPFVIRGGNLIRLPKFDVDFGQSAANTDLLEQNVSVAVIYGSVYVWTLRYSRRDASVSDVALYEVQQDISVPAQLKYVLSLGLPGMFGVHVINSLVIVHLQQQRRSLIFDVGVNDEFNQWALMEVEMTTSPNILALTAGHPLPLYSPSWVVFAPDIVIDPAVGIFTRLSLSASKAVDYIKDTSMLLQFLLNRADCRDSFLNHLAKVMGEKRLSIKQLREIFDTINDRIQEHEAKEAVQIMKNADSRLAFTMPPHQHVLITQDLLKSYVFIPVSEPADRATKKYVGNALLVYIRSLKARNIAVDPYLLELLVESLVAGNELSRLHQLVSYKTIGDSKPLAFLLISYETRYPPLFQAGVDMLMRAGGGDEIAEVLLAKGHLTEALRFMDIWVLAERPAAGLRLLERAVKAPRPVRHCLMSFFAQARKNKSANWPSAFKDIDVDSLFGEEEQKTAIRETAYADNTLENVERPAWWKKKKDEDY